MKFLAVKLGVIFIGLIMFSYAEVRAEDWKPLNTTESGGKLLLVGGVNREMRKRKRGN